MKNFILLLSILFFSAFSYSQSTAWNRSSKINKGMNLTWLDQRWNGTDAMGHRDYINLADLPLYKEQIKLIHEMGYNFLRLPVCFDLWYSDETPYALLTPQYYSALDSILQWTASYNMMLSIDFHHGKIRSENLNADVTRICAIWKDVSLRYRNTNSNMVLFEIFNEPADVNTNEWFSAAKKITAAIRSVDQQHTLIVGGAKWNGLDGLLEMPLLADTNVIYTFHFYEPFLFTHQGASWSGDAVSTTGIPYPYSSKRMPLISDAAANTWAKDVFPKYPSEAKYQSLYDRLKEAKDWSVKHNKPIFCGEWGAYSTYADANDRCLYLKDIYAILDKLAIPNAMWEWKEGFSFFTGAPAIDHVSPCMKDALRLK